jgi:hypothetical protein
VALLNRHGLKISKLARMEPDEIAHRVAEIAENNGTANTQIDALTLAMIDLDEANFHRVFSTFVAEHGFEQAMLELIYPFLNKLNILWLTNSISPAHEKFIGNLIRRKIMSAIDREPNDIAPEASTFVLYLPEEESQELTLLFMHYLLRNRGQKVVYLGLGCSLNDVKDACHAVHPDYIFTILQEPLPRQSIQTYLDQAAVLLASGNLLVTGAQMFIGPVKLPSNVTLLNGLPDTLQFLDKIQLKQLNSKQH